MSRLERINEDRRLALYLLAMLLLISLLSRLPNLTAPIADAHSWNQCSAASVIRNFHEKGIDLLNPEWNHLKKNSAARRIGAEELPLYHALIALLWNRTGEQESVARLVTIIISLIGSVYLFLLASSIGSNRLGLLAVFFYSFAPLNWFFGRAIMSDAAMLTATIAALHHFNRWIQTNTEPDFIWAAFWLALAGLLKPFALLAGVPILGLWLFKDGLRLFLKPQAYIFGLIVLVPTFAWLTHALNVGDLGGVTKNAGLADTDKIWGPIERLWDPKFYFRLQWRLFDRAITPIASLLAGLGLIAMRGSIARLPRFWLLGVVVYILLIRNGNYVHNYYQLPFVPVAALLAAMGFNWGLTRYYSKPAGKIAAFIVLAGFLVLSLIYVRSDFSQDLSSVKAGRLLEKVSTADDLVYILDPGSTRKNQAIYYSHRRGWHTNHCRPSRIEDYRKLGAAYFMTVLEKHQVTTNQQCLDQLKQTYNLLVDEKDDEDSSVVKHTYLIFDLSEPLKATLEDPALSP